MIILHNPGLAFAFFFLSRIFECWSGYTSQRCTLGCLHTQTIVPSSPGHSPRDNKGIRGKSVANNNITSSRWYVIGGKSKVNCGYYASRGKSVLGSGHYHVWIAVCCEETNAYADNMNMSFK